MSAILSLPVTAVAEVTNLGAFDSAATLSLSAIGSIFGMFNNFCPINVAAATRHPRSRIALDMVRTSCKKRCETDMSRSARAV
jgi:hypothetical protein